MKATKTGIILLLIVAVGIAFSACSGKIRYARIGHPEYQTKKTGPPPHAPAHGYRHKHSQGVVMVYESAIGVYVISDHPHHYYHKNKYYRNHNGSWQTSARWGGPWKSVKERNLPSGLRKIKKENKGKRMKH